LRNAQEPEEDTLFNTALHIASLRVLRVHNRSYWKKTRGRVRKIQLNKRGGSAECKKYRTSWRITAASPGILCQLGIHSFMEERP